MSKPNDKDGSTVFYGVPDDLLSPNENTDHLTLSQNEADDKAGQASERDHSSD